VGIKFIGITLNNPILWTGMKGVSAKHKKNQPDAETSLISISPRFSMTTWIRLSFFVIPNLFRDLGFRSKELMQSLFGFHRM
jgi:hypothetical protein